MTPSRHSLLLFPHYCLFCFYGVGDPPHLHSFPTRRSSDLATVHTPPVLTRRLQVTKAIQRRRGAPVPLFVFRGDRKSTRLNSSHRCISYAVFCLKKKKKKQRTTSPRSWYFRNSFIARVASV